jgi:hypothetical protein
MHRPNWIFVTATLILSGAAQAFKPLPSDAMADYQLGGAYDPPAGTNVVVRDSTATPARGLYNICYVNGFQTQPGVAWPLDLLVKNSKGKPLVDPEWPDEHLLDISSEKRRAAILERLAVTISGCARAGFNGFLHKVERCAQTRRCGRIRNIAGECRSWARTGGWTKECTTAFRPGAEADRVRFLGFRGMPPLRRMRRVHTILRRAGHQH